MIDAQRSSFEEGGAEYAVDIRRCELTQRKANPWIPERAKTES